MSTSRCAACLFVGLVASGCAPVSPETANVPASIAISGSVLDAEDVEEMLDALAGALPDERQSYPVVVLQCCGPIPQRMGKFSILQSWPSGGLPVPRVDVSLRRAGSRMAILDGEEVVIERFSACAMLHGEADISAYWTTLELNPDGAVSASSATNFTAGGP